jgi:uncharacterized membrane protein
MQSLSIATTLKKFLHIFRERPRLLVSTLIGLAVFILTPPSWRRETSGLVSWDVAVFIYLALVVHLAQSANSQRIRLRARLQDEGAIATLVFSCFAVTACMVAIAIELSAIKSVSSPEKGYLSILVGMTIPLAWLFIHSMFALHYAHEYYDAKDSKSHGLVFPGEPPRSYWDFLYFSLIIGTSAQTADISVGCGSLRKLTLVHCVLSFFFNITLLGLAINVASSLL